MALETRPWTRADLDRLPDDGNRYEVLDGTLLVTPAPSAPHQRIVAWLSGVLTPFVMAHGIGVVHFPRSVIVIDGSQVEPDLMVLPPAPFDEWENAPHPLLVIEVLSATTRRRDLMQKRAFYEKGGIAEYWVVDREARVVTQIQGEIERRISTTLRWSPQGSPETLAIDIARMFSDLADPRA